MPQTRHCRSPLRVCATGQFFAAKIKVRNHAVSTRPAIFILMVDGRAIMSSALADTCLDEIHSATGDPLVPAHEFAQNAAAAVQQGKQRTTAM
jgi:hypothetical protein